MQEDVKRCANALQGDCRSIRKQIDDHAAADKWQGETGEVADISPDLSACLDGFAHAMQVLLVSCAAFDSTRCQP
jgi:hypothetical protein